ncbi:hypothetical protein BDK51DRAFT_37293 [Blyttiomyces helicus]|uniref:Uncharacterized protein n=1 Tax=Blyttiomyces helicus TaxID=388810 RepID=A0A4P9VYU1_9FUNG|nr:hypothetical protein BDK51DRAFT_37293 [Blyttiomyces helicus]|eukprot:RKO84452.1 hypothetical protein BDK51DRAFT_37293 [Blyttiomyces helicus]
MRGIQAIRGVVKLPEIRTVRSDMLRGVVVRLPRRQIGAVRAVDSGCELVLRLIRQELERLQPANALDDRFVYGGMFAALDHSLKVEYDKLRAALEQAGEDRNAHLPPIDTHRRFGRRFSIIDNRFSSGVSMRKKEDRNRTARTCDALGAWLTRRLPLIVATRRTIGPGLPMMSTLRHSSSVATGPHALQTWVQEYSAAMETAVARLPDKRPNPQEHVPEHILGDRGPRPTFPPQKDPPARADGHIDVQRAWHRVRIFAGGAEDAAANGERLARVRKRGSEEAPISRRQAAQARSAAPRREPAIAGASR